MLERSYVVAEITFLFCVTRILTCDLLENMERDHVDTDADTHLCCCFFILHFILTKQNFKIKMPAVREIQTSPCVVRTD